MPTFAYKALRSDNATVNGTLEAGGRQEALRALKSQGLTPIKLTEATSQTASNSSSLQLPWEKKRVPFAALEDFTRSLSSLLAANVPLSRALTILYKESSVPVAAEKWRELHDRVIDGVSLADAMAKSPDVFPRVYVAMVQAGETGGFLDVVLSQIADFQARDRELKAKVLSAMLYPGVLMSLAVVVLIYLLVFFIPRFQTLFAGFQAALPALTQIIVAISDIVRGYGLYLAIAATVAVILGRSWITREQNRRIWEGWMLRAPIVGPLASKIAMARFCRMLGTLLGAGVPLINGLSVARRSLGYQVLIDLITDSSDRVKKGEALAASLADCKSLFSGSTLEMIAVAEESGRLDQELLRLSGVTETALDRQLKTAVALTEPLMLFLIAGFIGIIFIGMVIPIFTIQDYIK
ncbi:MAG: type II secretion system F family protein [Limisphaerales bacterium]|jgi:type II secretory pathway component PulF